MSLHRAMRDLSAPAPTSERRAVGPVVLFIGAVLIAGLTCILYLWQQGRIVAGTQDIVSLDRQVTVLQQQRDELLAQEQRLTSVTHIVAQASRLGMVEGDARTVIALTSVPGVVHPSTLAQVAPSKRSAAQVLPATNAAITSWWQSAWDGLYGLTR